MKKKIKANTKLSVKIYASLFIASRELRKKERKEVFKERREGWQWGQRDREKIQGFNFVWLNLSSDVLFFFPISERVSNWVTFILTFIFLTSERFSSLVLFIGNQGEKFDHMELNSSFLWFSNRSLTVDGHFSFLEATRQVPHWRDFIYSRKLWKAVRMFHLALPCVACVASQLYTSLYTWPLMHGLELDPSLDSRCPADPVVHLPILIDWLSRAEVTDH